ncbi:MAG: hypothetical protein NTV56_10540, partial [Alphaproteobacteria bacterium]|nr:hypothetical protein [Alphaproteobacteria bacterium]
PDAALRAHAAAAGAPPVGLRPPFVTPAAAHSHPDCRGILTLIVAPHWRDYKTAFHREGMDEIVFRGHFCLDTIKALNVPTVINFGCLYGWLENELHKVGFAATGVDRSQGTAALNRAEFPGPTFAASDILDFLPGCDLAGRCFAHLNTGTLVLPNVLAESYRLAHAAGARYVLIFEPNGGSRITGRYFPYSTEPRQSVVFRDGMLLHNYPALLRGAGFRVIRQEVLHPLHPHRDYRSIFFLAERHTEQ